jgi:hypothetical protein
MTSHARIHTSQYTHPTVVATPRRPRRRATQRAHAESFSRQVDQAPSSNSASPSFCCPVCFQKFAAGSYHCARCDRTYATIGDSGSGSPAIQDLTISSQLQRAASVEIFKNPLVSSIYQRGWRQSFAWAGFPGLDEEASAALDVFRQTSPKVLVDMSCGSGLFTKKFIEYVLDTTMSLILMP